MQGFVYRRCGDCRSLFLGTPADDTRLSSVYASAAYAEQRGHSNDLTVAACKSATVAVYLQRLRRHFPRGSRYLEIGCSAGAGLSAAAALGWEAEGVEVSPAAAAIAGRLPGVKAVHHGTVLGAPFADASFDVVTLFDVIEHIDPPQPTVQRVFDLLAPGGLILLVTPDADSLSARALGARWPHLFPDHVICFTRDALRRVLVAAGFEVVQMGFAWKRVNLNILIRHAHLHPNVVGGRMLRSVGALLPSWLADRPVPFNVGEFYAIARRTRI